MDLLLQRDCVGGHDELTALINSVDYTGYKVSEALADASAGLEQERRVVCQRSGHGAGHLRLLRTVIEPELGAQQAGLGEDVSREFPES